MEGTGNGRDDSAQGGRKREAPPPATNGASVQCGREREAPAPASASADKGSAAEGAAPTKEGLRCND
eukprot:2097102-Pyramimonas_sp.AAC.1